MTSLSDIKENRVELAAENFSISSSLKCHFARLVFVILLRYYREKTNDEKRIKKKNLRHKISRIKVIEAPHTNHRQFKIMFPLNIRKSQNLSD